MKDIDFDELDKAVNDVLGNVTPETNNTTPVAAAVVAPQPSAAPLVAPRQTVGPISTIEPAVIPAQPVAEPSQPSAASPAVRRGRFMDVVHPSSDMSSGSPATTVSAPSVRPPSQSTQPLVPPTSRKLAPISASVVPDERNVDAIVAPATPAEVSPISETQIEDFEPKLDTIEAAPYSVAPADTPSPLPGPNPDVDADNDETDLDMLLDEASDMTPSEPVGDDSIDDQKLDEVISQAAEPQVTPFLSDTKVDKRPLGAFTGEEAGAQFPQELDPKMINIESTEATDSAQLPARSDESVLVSPENTADDVQLQHMFNQSGDHQLLLPKKTKRSPVWIWIVLVVVLLAVGSGLGYFWFVNGY